LGWRLTCSGKRPVDWNVVPRYCAPDEIADIGSQDGRWHDRFLRYWTLKEAYLKARGVGISVPLADITFRVDTDRADVSFGGALRGSDARWIFRLAQRHDLGLMARRGLLDLGNRHTPHSNPTAR